MGIHPSRAFCTPGEMTQPVEEESRVGRALQNSRVCFRCGLTIIDPDELACPRCGGMEISHRNARPIYTAPLRKRDLGFPFCAAIPPGATILLSGNRGAGKTTACMSLFRLDAIERAVLGGMFDPKEFSPLDPRFEDPELVEQLLALPPFTGDRETHVELQAARRAHRDAFQAMRRDHGLLRPTNFRPGMVRIGRWISSEQEVEQIKDAWYRTHGPHSDPPNVAYAYSWEDLFQELLGLQVGEIVVVDSITQLGASTSDVNTIVKSCIEAIRKSQAIGIFIAQYTKDGTVAGPNMLGHMVDAVAEILRGKDGLRRFVWGKNRFGDEPVTYFKITGKGIEPQDWPYAYSVEGPAGNYQLVTYPASSKQKYDGLFRFMEDEHLRLARGSLASAAVINRIYDQGYAEPVDAGERRRFAEANGLDWLHPTHVFDLCADYVTKIAPDEEDDDPNDPEF